MRVLIIDSDPQGNATTGLGVEKSPDRPSIYHLLLGSASPAEAIVATDLDGLFLISADKNLVGANIELVEVPNRENRLRERIADVRANYDFILIDCPP